MFRVDIADFTHLETPRLLIRRLSLADAQDIYEISSDDAVSRYVLWSTHRSIADSRAFLKQALRRYRTGEPATWAIQLKESGRVIGTIGFVEMSREDSSAEVGYSLGRAYWNRGYATEALRAVIAFGMEKMRLNRIEAQYDVDNPASGRVMEKAGMVPEGILRQRFCNKGRYVDVCLCAILQRDYRAQKAAAQAQQNG